MSNPCRTADYLRQTHSEVNVLKIELGQIQAYQFMGAYQMFSLTFQLWKTPIGYGTMLRGVNAGVGRIFTVLVRLATSAVNEDGKFNISASAWIGPSSSDIKPRLAAGCGMVIDEDNCVTVSGQFDPVMIQLTPVQSTMTRDEDEEDSDDDDCESESRVLFPGLVLSVMRDGNSAYVSFLPPRHLVRMQIVRLHSTGFMDVPEGKRLPVDHKPYTIPRIVPKPPPVTRRPALAEPPPAREAKRKSRSTKD